MQAFKIPLHLRISHLYYKECFVFLYLKLHAYPTSFILTLRGTRGSLLPRLICDGPQQIWAANFPLLIFYIQILKRIFQFEI